MMMKPIQRSNKAAAGIKIIRQRLLDSVKGMRQLIARSLALNNGTLGREPLLGVCDLRLLSIDRLGEIVARQRAGGDRCFQLRANFLACIEVGFEQVMLDR